MTIFRYKKIKKYTPKSEPDFKLKLKYYFINFVIFVIALLIALSVVWLVK